MPPCGTPDTSFIEFEIDVPIFTLWLRPVRKVTNHLQVFCPIRRFLVSHKIRMGTRCHKLQIDPTVRYQFSAYYLSSESILVALRIVQSLWIFLNEIHVGFLAGVHVFPCSVLLDHTLFFLRLLMPLTCNSQVCSFLFWLGLLFSVLGLLGPLSTLKEIHH